MLSLIQILGRFYQGNVIQITFLHFLLVGFLVSLSIKRIKEIFIDAGFGKEELLSLLFLVIIGLIVFSLSNEEFRASDWTGLNLAKSFLKGETERFSYSNYGPEYPFLLSILFFIFEVSTEVASAFSIFMALLGVVSVFLFTYLFSEDLEASSISALVFMFFPSIIYYTSLLKGRTIVVITFFSLTLLSFLLSYKLNTPTGYLLSALVLINLINLKIEFLSFLPLFLIGYWAFKEELELSKFKLVPVSFLFLLNLTSKIPMYLSPHQGALASLQGEKAGNFSFVYFFRNLSSFFSFWKGELSFMFLSFLFLGLSYFIYKKKKKGVFLISSFLLPHLIYFNYYVVYATRYAVLAIPCLASLIGIGFKTVRKVMETFKLESIHFPELIVFFLILFSIPLSQFKTIRGKLNSFKKLRLYKEQSHKIAANLKKVTGSDPYIIVPHAQTAWMVRFMTGYEVHNLGARGVLSDEVIDAYYSNNLSSYENYELELPVRNRSVYLLTNQRCENKEAYFSHFWYFCNAILSSYNQTLEVERDHYRVYSLS